MFWLFINNENFGLNGIREKVNFGLNGFYIDIKILIIPCIFILKNL